MSEEDYAKLKMGARIELIRILFTHNKAHHHALELAKELEPYVLGPLEELKEATTAREALSEENQMRMHKAIIAAAAPKAGRK